MNKKANLGLDTIKPIVIMLLIIAVLVITSIFATVTLQGVYEDIEAKTTTAIVNESHAVDTAGFALDYNPSTRRNAVCTISTVINDSSTVNTTTWSESGCIVTNTTSFTGTPWNVTYSVTYNSANVHGLVRNMTIGEGKFFTYVPTIFVLLAVVVLILIISIVIVAVSRFTGGSGSIEV